MAAKKKIYTVIFSISAEQELLQIEQYISENQSEIRAVKVLTSIFEKIWSIAEHPFSFPVLISSGNKSEETLRCTLVHSAYKIIYKIHDEHIEVLKIFDGSRDPKLLNKLFDKKNDD